MSSVANFNRLSPAETERLAYLIEEASEVIKVASKILRHGWTSVDRSVTPAVLYDNQQELVGELRDLRNAVSRLVHANEVPLDILALYPKRLLDANQYMHHQQDEPV